MDSKYDSAACEIIFLDCRGYYDLAAEILGLISTMIIVYRSLNNYKELRQEKNLKIQSEYYQSMKIKININLLNIVYLLIFVAHLIFSMIVFQMLNQKSNNEILQMQIEKWYKISEILYIQLLNCVLLSVGWLYWKTLHSFYQIKRLQIPFFYHSNVIYIFGISVLYFLIAFIAPAIFIFIDEIRYKMTLNLIILVSSGLSVAIFIIFRIMYYKNIFKSIKFSKSIIRRQQIYNFLILFSGIFRITMCLLQILQQDFQFMRKYSNQCHDLSPNHGITLLFMTFIINLLPSFIFTKIFTTFQRQRASKSDIQRTLFSAQYSQYQVSTQK